MKRNYIYIYIYKQRNRDETKIRNPILLNFKVLLILGDYECIKSRLNFNLIGIK